MKAFRRLTPTGKSISMSCNPRLFLFSFLSFGLTRNLASSQNSTLLFAKDNNVRNCSCSSDIKSCEYSLANLMCNCKSVLFQRNRTLSRISYTGDLVVWFTDTSILGQLLNFTFVHDLKLSLCGALPLPTDYLAIIGLRRLEIHTANSTEQRLVIYNHDKKPMDKTSQNPSEKTSLLHISYLDTSLFNGPSLKAYSVEDVSSINEQFPNLPYPNTFSVTNMSYIVTLIY
ncbi:uncharacterized protein C21orf62 [Xenopus laevis]|uniref:Uncharacterized protein C21orf62 n=2 Tax=Xenopus laevis TaxID=8355 RepID=A0A1L8HCM9_XENLA|nr:uncharacterized protein C21orf62 [Xenopus laevis]XP_041437499.1 uncharacterized protein C21orf62 [Xenopus laevis]OCT93826.1 hypothetical protein XELAEV_18011497mg [Xenopus laevis]